MTRAGRVKATLSALRRTAGQGAKPDTYARITSACVELRDRLSPLLCTTRTERKDTPVSSFHNVIRAVAETGEVPSKTEIDALIDAGNSRQTRHAQRKALHTELRTIAQWTNEGHGDTARDMAEAAIASFAPYNSQASSDQETTHVGRYPSSSTGEDKPDRSALAPLRDLFGHAAGGGEVTATEVDALITRTDVSERERTEWRNAVLAEAKRINRVRDTGQNGNARRAVLDATENLGHLMAAPERESIDHLNPNELAQIIGR